MIIISKLRCILNILTDIVNYTISRIYPKFEDKRWNRLFLKNRLKPILTNLNYSFIVHPHDKFSSESLFRKKTLYEDIYMILKTFSILCNSFLDIGANIGYFTVTIGDSFANKGLVVGIEPEPINFKILKRNIKNNNVKAIIEPLALSDKEGSAELLVNIDNKGGHSLFTHDPSYYSGKITVKTATLNNIVKKYNFIEPILVKIDVEGYELNVLKAGEDLLKKRCIIILEFSPGFYDILGQNPMELLELFKNHGYKVYDIDTEQLIEPKSFEKLCEKPQSNLILINL